ncbi:hypothetical protein BV898_00135 [Hypsibius exemplaris]|uniref:G-protein coupled receptors family 1 profile domain-containing protein n=1 Tax=Hypsibius exemplaris TaxID=2072580 RepID=A0A1W0XF72_HYPEX|nr:hypothetical protein BV898_00135 [Hypsibius exemplaris]
MSLSSEQYAKTIPAQNSTTNLSITALPGLLSPLKQVELFLWIIFTTLLCFVGVINNTLVLLVTWPKTNGTTGLNLLIFHFIFINLFICLFNIPVSIFMILAKQAGFVPDPAACQYIQTLYTTGFDAVNWSDAFLASSRFVVFFFPHNYQAWTTKTANFGIIMLTWFVSFGAVLPVAFGMGGKMLMLPLGQCVYLPLGPLGKFFTASMSLPYGIASLGSLLILCKTCHVSRLYGMVSDRHRRIMVHRIRLAKMLLFTILWSVICSVPLGVITLNFQSMFVENPVSVLWLRTCLASQCGFTPCILLLSNAEYRSRLARMFDCIFISADALADDMTTGNRKSSFHPPEFWRPADRYSLLIFDPGLTKQIAVFLQEQTPATNKTSLRFGPYLSSKNRIEYPRKRILKAICQYHPFTWEDFFLLFRNSGSDCPFSKRSPKSAARIFTSLSNRSALKVTATIINSTSNCGDRRRPISPRHGSIFSRKPGSSSKIYRLSSSPSNSQSIEYPTGFPTPTESPAGMENV